MTTGIGRTRSAITRAANIWVSASSPRMCRAHLVCRAGWMMGGGPAKDKKFVQKLMKQLKDGKRELFVVDDKLGTPTYTIDFARNVDLLLGTGLVGHLQHGLPGRDQPARSCAISGARAWDGGSSEGHARLVGLFRGGIFRRAARVGAADHEKARPARPQHHARLARLPRGVSRRRLSGALSRVIWNGKFRLLALASSSLALAGCVVAPFVWRRRTRVRLLYGILMLVAATAALAIFLSNGVLRTNVNGADRSITISNFRVTFDSRPNAS